MIYSCIHGSSSPVGVKGLTDLSEHRVVDRSNNVGIYACDISNHLVLSDFLRSILLKRLNVSWLWNMDLC